MMTYPCEAPSDRYLSSREYRCPKRAEYQGVQETVDGRILVSYMCARHRDRFQRLYGDIWCRLDRRR